ncbi:hypothetical protein CEN49_23415, partial [Fischerella thermalis CCMEE 5273]
DLLIFCLFTFRQMVNVGDDKDKYTLAYSWVHRSHLDDLRTWAFTMVPDELTQETDEIGVEGLQLNLTDYRGKADKHFTVCMTFIPMKSLN